MPLTAFLGRLFGQKRLYLFCLVLFVIGSALCGMASSLPALIFFRVIQGLGAGALQPTEQAILRQTFPPKEQGMAMAVFAMAVMIGPALGPTLGGYIVDNWSWPWIFYINVPVGILAYFMVRRFVHEAPDLVAANRAMAEKQRKNMDWLGIALLSVGLACLQYVLEEGGRKDWFDSPLITALTLISLFVLAAFVIRELTAPVPAVDISLFKDKVFLSGTLVGSVMFAMLMAVTFLLPVFMQELLGFNAMQSGLALMPRSLVMFVATPIVGKLYNKVSPRGTVAFGVVLFAISAYQMSHYTLMTSASGVWSVLVIQGVAFSCLFVPLTTVALASIPRHRMPDATGLNSLLRQIGGSVGLAIFATRIESFAATAAAGINAHLVAGRPEVMQRLGGMAQMLQARGFDAASAQQAARRALQGAVMQQSMVLTFEKLFLLAGILFLVVLPLLLFLKTPSQNVGPKVDVHIEV
jgi:DHA2 family multidrug resistance protein